MALFSRTSKPRRNDTTSLLADLDAQTQKLTSDTERRMQESTLRALSMMDSLR